MMEKAWQDVLDRFHYGIYLVTVASAEGCNGMIASWVTQCSHEPPRVAIAIRKNRFAHEQILNAGEYGINVLPKEFIHEIKQFKIADWKSKFDTVQYTSSPNGLPVLDDCIGYMDCLLEQAVDAGDHTLFIGRITAGSITGTGDLITLSTSDYNGVYRGSK